MADLSEIARWLSVAEMTPWLVGSEPADVAVIRGSRVYGYDFDCYGLGLQFKSGERQNSDPCH